MTHRLAVVLALAASVAAAAPDDKAAQTVSEFGGEVKVDKGQARPPRKLALLDATSVASHTFDHALLESTTQAGVQQLADGLRQRGFEVLAGPVVVDAFRQMPGVLANTAELEKIAAAKWGYKPEHARKFIETLQKKAQQGVHNTAPMVHSRSYRAPDTVDVRALLVKNDGSKLSDYESPSAKDVQKRIAALAERLGVDGVIVVQFDLLPQERSQMDPAGQNKGLFGAIRAVKQAKENLKGDRTRAGIDLDVYGKDGKETLISAQGYVITKEGGGVFTKNDELRALVPVAMNGLVATVLGEIDKELK